MLMILRSSYQIADIEKGHHAIRIYERATGAQINPYKSRALAVGGWSEPIIPLGIELFQQVTILGVTFGSTVDATVQERWTRVTIAVRAQALTPATCASPTGYNMYKRTS